MRKSMGRLMITWALAMVLLGIPAARGAELLDKAAPLKIAQWVKGGPVTLTTGTVHVIEFWATWCPPCRESIPHLTELAHKYKDKVIFVGISDETENKVRPFVEKMGAKMDYVVALDDKRATSAAYMEAYGQNGIPAAFVIDKEGRVVWVGHPMAELEKVLDQVLAGKLDTKAVGERQKLQKAMDEYFKLASSGTASPDHKAKLDAAGQRIMTMSPADPESLSKFAWTITQSTKLKHRDPKLALDAAKKAYELDKGQNPIIIHVYAGILHKQGQKTQAIGLQKKAIGLTTDPELKAYLEKALSEMEK